MTRPMVKEALGYPEDRPLEGQRDRELDVVDLAMLSLGGLLVVDDPPQRLEELLAQKAGDEPAGDAEWDEQELHRSTPSALALAASAEPPAPRLSCGWPNNF